MNRLTHVYATSNTQPCPGTPTGTAYTWDDSGNLLSDGAKTYTYNHANRLTAVSGAGVAVSYVYNGLGERVSETVNGVTTDFVLDLAAERRPTGKMLRRRKLLEICAESPASGARFVRQLFAIKTYRPKKMTLIFYSFALLSGNIS